MIELLSRQFCLARHYPLLTLKETCRSTVCKRNISRSVAYHHSFNKSHVVKTTIAGYGGICIPSLRRPVLAAVYGQAFHTSPKRHLHPIFWLLAKPAGKVASIITGRTLRKWWKGLPLAEKSKVKEKLVYHRLKIAALVGLAIAAGIFNFATHIQEAPITKRRRYIAFTEEQFLKIARYELEIQWESLKERVVDPKDPKAKKLYDIIVNVAQKIIDSNQHLDLLKQQKWNVIVIDSNEANAFVLPTGQIFVFRGILELTENEDQLAVVLGHEIAHVILSHGAEKVSMAGLLDVLVILVMAGIWFFMPSDGIAIVTQWFYNKVMTLLLHLPYSRKLEAEADLVGLQLISRACFDVREASTFWQRMALNEVLIAKGELPAPDWNSTHPSSEKRAVILNDLIPEAIDLRKSCNCSRLPRADPREQFQLLKALIEDQTQKENEELIKEKAAVTPSPPPTEPVTVPAKPVIKPAKPVFEPDKHPFKPANPREIPVSQPRSPAAAAITATKS